MNNEITNILAPVAKAGAAGAVAGFVLGTLIGWLLLPDAMRPWQFGIIFALVSLLLVLLAATPYVWRRYSGQS
jgi:F0F1-type ATP synthase assembly protein I